MNDIFRSPLTMDGKDPCNLRGDPIDAERYFSKEFAQKEWDHLWTKIWHIAGRTNELQEAGDYIVHDFMHESVIVVRQQDGGLKGFYNSCGHRGIRLVSGSSYADEFKCPYHGWTWAQDGSLASVPDADNFARGNPCGKIRLREVRVGTWGGFVWYTMNPDAPELLDYLAPFPRLFEGYPMETLIRVYQVKIDMRSNWKFAPDNFSESYHVRTAHPQIPSFIDQDHWIARLEMFPNGHGRTVQPFRPSLRDRLPDGVANPFDGLLREWDIDPAGYPDFETKVSQGWLDMKAQKRRLWKARGFHHYEHMDDEQLTDSIHTTLFPNISITFNPDSIFLMRTEPDPDDPNRSTFDFWAMAFPVEGATHSETPMVGDEKLPLVEAEPLRRSFDQGRGVPELAGGVIVQDLYLAEDVQRGLRSRGYQEPYLANSETRVGFFHEVLNDYIAGRR
ncbi:aromatic ring-hydroxylating oxygenase subunit alpha [Sphingomonas profundi]|uniref:aromatic ring-hydroxylating oxygenase subunit alpha n=1 Tax=Alterirhizorhabdus profundi TaxID=2681549 RepID=UPI0012E73F92|nr:aromatic ring-hydroxylating dioxygenase subunit alpha [Sphingomonas profundi]